MRAFVVAIVGLLASSSSATASSSFHADVVRRTNVRKNQLRQEQAVNDELLAKAIPVREFEGKHGVKLGDGGRQLEEFQMDYNDMYSFSGYSLTYAKCQPVQYFSDEAVEMGSYSPMITEDIVVLRLCPSNSCSDSKEYGCYYNYAEYAIELSDYLNIMLRYATQKKEYMCQYCDECLGNNGNRRRLEDGADEGGEDQQDQQNDADGQDEAEQQQENQDEDQQDEKNNNQEQEQEQQEEDAAGNDAAQADYDNNNAAADDDQGDDFYKNACAGWDSYCSDYANQCAQNENNGGNNYLDYEGYLDYLECSEVNYNNARYYIKPRCDGYHNTIKMTVHYDAYCTQTSSGNDMSIKNLGLGMRDSTFQDFYSGECVDCSESEYPPYDATSTMCNLIHYTSAKCVSDMEYNAFDNGDDVDDTTECSYIESIRTGTYDETGTITLRSFGFTSEKITAAQTGFLCLFVLLTVGLTVYACYLHHAMTNLLIKSLSHRELLPPSRHASRRSSPRRSGRRLKKVGGDSDWDDGNEFA
mmetsp:Transcript_19337/g.36496  ORF Transcript_19337/g.36496 Transcript_19337/m.36496 type:complete len:528 (-) Transcript_19337:2492-4075(-)